jgi:hypothetical protein
MTSPSGPPQFLELSPKNVRAAEKTLPKLGWTTLPLSLLVTIAVLLTAYEIPTSHRSTTLVITYAAVFGAFCGYASGLVMVDLPSLLKGNAVKRRLANLLRRALIVLCCGSLLGMAIYLGWYLVLLAGSPAAGPEEVHFTFYALAYFVTAGASTAFTAVNAALLTRILDISRQEERTAETAGAHHPPAAGIGRAPTVSPTME